MAKFISNAFSIQMLEDLEKVNQIKIEPVAAFPKEECTSIVGHKDTASVLGVRCNREFIKLGKDDELYIAQLTGGRLPEGSTTLPDNFSFKYFKVSYIQA